MAAFAGDKHGRPPTELGRGLLTSQPLLSAGTADDLD
jgi:hypothetical protein